MGGAIGKLFGGGKQKAVQVVQQELPKTIDYEAERKSAEEDALRRKQQAAGKGMSGTMLGGSEGESLSKKKLLGE